jgi:hypothetical protein
MDRPFPGGEGRGGRACWEQAPEQRRSAWPRAKLGAMSSTVGTKRNTQPAGRYRHSLIVVVAATIASLALAWARNGAIADLLSGVLDHVRSLFGMG